jgi:RimJ/RimL family protein N-acetyltransferase
MFELDAAHIASVRPLFEALSHLIPLTGVLNGDHLGRIFVDDPVDPAVALAWTPWGYYYLGGGLGAPGACEMLSDLLRETLIPASVAGGERGLLVTLSAPRWETKLERLWGLDGAVRIRRRTFSFDSEAFAVHRCWSDYVPPGFSMQRVGCAEAQLLEGELRATWPSMDAFLARGLGFCLLHEGEPVSACTSAFVAGGAVEIGVYTDAAYRRQGLATLTGAALIEACLERGLRPNWECFADNKSSVALARKLGFVPSGEYPIYYWEV